MRRALAGLALALALAVAACAGPPSLNDAQQVIADLKFAGAGAPTDLAVTGEFDRRDGGYHAGDTIGLTVTANQPAWIAVLRVMRGGETAIVFPNRSQPDARAASGVVHVEVPAGRGGIELFKFIAATNGTAWPFTRKPAAGADYVDLGSTTRAIFTDLTTTFKGAAKGTVAASDKAIKVSD